MPILNVPPKVDENCVSKKKVNCGSSIDNNNVNAPYEVLFPTNFAKLPMSGGAILKFDISSLNLTPSNTVGDIVAKNLLSLKSLEVENTLQDVSKVRTNINSSLFDIARRNIKVVNNEEKKNKKAPYIYFCNFKGENPDVLKSGIASSEIIRICEFRYIPFNIFKEILKNILTSNESFSSVVGISGKTFSQLLDISASSDDADIASLLLEFFPVVNVSDNDILAQESNPIIGGYYTIKDGNVYLKMPDLSGRDAAGFSESDLNDDSNIYFEILSGTKLSRLKVENFAFPPRVSIFGDQNIEFPKEKELEVKVEIPGSPSVLPTLYLSPILPFANVQSSRSIDTYNTGVEIFTVPLLTKSIEGIKGIEGGLSPIISEESSPSINDIDYSNYQKYFGESIIEDKTQVGFPSDGNGVNTFSLFGEMNRPEIILSDNGSVTKKNNRKYWSLASSGTTNILSSIMPKIYSHVPYQWPSSSLKSEGDGIYLARFSANYFEGLNLSDIGGEIQYAVYAKDNNGQIVRAFGPNIVLREAVPYIAEIQPNGYDDSSILLIKEQNTLNITGKDLGGVQTIRIESEDNPLIFKQFGSGDPEVVISDEVIGLILKENSLGASFSANTPYKIIISGAGVDSVAESSIYFSEDLQSTRPLPEKTTVKFKDREFYSSYFKFDPVIGIPLFRDSSNAEILIKSRSRVFKSKNDIFAYLALPMSSENKRKITEFSLEQDIKTVSVNGFSLLVPIDIEYKFENTGDFSRVTEKEARIRFPGSDYAGRNFSSLLGQDEAYFLFLNRDISELLGANISSFDSEQACLIRLGNKEPNKVDKSGSAFIEPASVMGLVVENYGNVISTFEKGYFGSILEGEFSKEPEVGIANLTGTIDKLALIVSGIKEPFLKRRYSFKIGTTDITENLSKKPDYIGNNKLLFIFENINLSGSGILKIQVEKNERIFGSSYSYENYVGQATFAIDNESQVLFEINNDTKELTIIGDIANNKVISDVSSLDFDSFGILGSDGSYPIDSLFPRNRNSGFLSLPIDSDDFVSPFVPIDITPATKLRMGIDPFSEQAEVLAAGVPATVSWLAKGYLELEAGTSFGSRYYLSSDDNKKALLFASAYVDNLASIKYNVSEVISVGPSTGELIDIDSEEVITLVAGDNYTVVVSTTERDFTLLLDDIEVKPVSRPKPMEGFPGRYRAEIIIPDELADIEIGNGDCFEICASSSNSERNRAEFNLGKNFAENIELYDKFLEGPFKDQIPNIQEKFDTLKDFPLRYVSLKIDSANVPKDLIRSFCDLSFSLVGELKTSLNGFKILMVPIQVIFCIIDVICSLLNPIKVAKAVIRLFQCLYDLILLLPQISVPVMFLQLILHLLQLLLCIVDKLLLTITAINEIARAINEASKPPVNYEAIKSLEERLSEYLFEIQADLSIFEPILSILAIFIQLLQLAFRFPCNINPGSAQPDCGIDGTILAGIVAGIAAPDLDEIDPTVMLPVGQTYSTDLSEGSTSPSNVVRPLSGYEIANNSGQTFYDSLNINSETLRADSSLDFNVTMAPTFTKSIKSGGKPNLVKFKFNEKGLTTNLNSKNIDPNQTVDSPLMFLRRDGNSIVTSQNGNLISPIDGEEFLDIDGDKASVKPLVLNFEVPIIGINEVTGQPEQTGVDVVTRTFDNIPKMVIMDDEFNVYFVEDNGIKFNSAGVVDTISAKVINKASASKIKFSREEVEIDTDGDGDIDSDDDGSTIKIFDFPQLYFFDMRQAAEQLEQFCSTASINNFPFEDNDTEDIENLVEEGTNCITTWLDGIRGLVGEVRSAQEQGNLPIPEISIESFEALNQELIDCLTGTADDMCKYVVNSLNTSFKVLEDNDETPLPEFVDGSITDDILGDFDEVGPPFTGAREYAAGIGDSAIVNAGNEATIEIIPRDAYDEDISGDLTSKIKLEIISDSTNSANFNQDDGGIIIVKNGNSYTAKLKAENEGEVKIRARICERTIQALTYQGIDVSGTTTSNSIEVDCIPDTVSEITTGSPPLGALTKVDRILTIYFAKRSGEFSGASSADDSLSAVSEPQEFGSGLEN